MAKPLSLKKEMAPGSVDNPSVDEAPADVELTMVVEAKPPIVVALEAQALALQRTGMHAKSARVTEVLIAASALKHRVADALRADEDSGELINRLHEIL